jgi:hypothetical protein
VNFVLESVEVLCNLSLNYNEIFLYYLRELLRVGRRYDLPASLERSAKAVLPEGCGPLWFNCVATTQKQKLKTDDFKEPSYLIPAVMSTPWKDLQHQAGLHKI